MRNAVMKSLNIAILGCGNVGGGVARILTELKEELSVKASCNLELKKIVELYPEISIKRFDLPADLFCGGGRELTVAEADKYIEELVHSDDIDIIVEAIGGSGDSIYRTAINICKSKKHLVTANKALLAERGKGIFDAANENNVIVGYEASVCAAIPIVKTIKECFTGDSIVSISGIMNGTSNYILSKMQNENLEFKEALKMARKEGYAEADPTLDINGYDAGHKLIILIKLAFGINITIKDLLVKGIDNINKEDIGFASEIDSKIKLICYAKRIDGKIYATVCPMMVKNSNFLSEVNGPTNAIRVINKYSGRHILIGSGAGSLETASSIVADIVFIARYSAKMKNDFKKSDFSFINPSHFVFPYMIIFDTVDIPGITGLVTTSVGHQDINIDTVGHNRHIKDRALFSVATTPCTLQQVENAIKEIRSSNPKVLLKEPKIMPILY
jgi:homoserine dehydrogenase